MIRSRQKVATAWYKIVQILIQPRKEKLHRKDNKKVKLDSEETVIEQEGILLELHRYHSNLFQSKDNILV